MNITDIDDKIIRRVKENIVYRRCVEDVVTNLKFDQVRKIISQNQELVKVFDAILSKRMDKKAMLVFFHTNSNLKRMILESMPLRDVVIDEDYYYSFIKQMEADFFADMDKLGIQRPNVVTRVTEYIEKMKHYIERIEDNGYAYAYNGSVYLDSQKFKAAGHDFSPLRKGADNDYSENEYTGEKKHNADFALWKAAKTGELKFKSRWGLGRPGWHIECSVMASDILGDSFDIHSGGIDLSFPHHNNEIVQAMAFRDIPNSKWVECFLHSGHLNIEGLKMSKSLKNFVTIKEYLQQVGTAQQLRILFLLHGWDKPLDYSEDTIDEAKRVEKRLKDFFDHVRFVERENKGLVNKLTETDIKYRQDLTSMKSKIDQVLRCNINTPKIFKLLLKGINETYVYLKCDFNVTFVREFSQYARQILGVFGLTFDSDKESGNHEQYIKLAVELREDVRDIVISNKTNIGKGAVQSLFKVLDDFRDTKMKDVGLKLEDLGENSSTKWS